MNQSDIAQTLESEGMVVVPDVFTADFMDAVARDIDAATKVCLGIQLEQRVGQDSSLMEALEGGDGADGFLLYLGMGNDKVIDFNSSEGDELLLANGLTGYQFANTSTGAVYSLEDGSSLELVYELIA